MTEYNEPIRLTLPSRKVAIGTFTVSDDGEFLFIFKDSIGIYAPYPKLVNELSADRPGRIDCHMSYFNVSETDSPTFPIKFIHNDERPSPEVARYALSYCDRTLLSMAARTVEAKDYLSHAFRNADWSPSGLDQFSRTVFSCVTGNRQLCIVSRDVNRWTLETRLSKLWIAFWKSRGLTLLSEGRREFLEIPVEENLNSDSESSEELVCTNVHEYYSSVEETSFLKSSWSKKLRISKRHGTRHNSLLVALHKSGTISFWDISVPMIDQKSVRLAAVDRTYSVTFDPPNLPPRPNFIKNVDINNEKLLLVIGLTNSRIVCVFYQAYAKQMGVLSVIRLSEHELCRSSVSLLPVGDVAFKDGVLAVAQGTRVFLANVINQKRVQFVIGISNNAIMKTITGIRFFRNHLFISSQDGIIARSTIPTQTKKKYELMICNQSLPEGDKNYHRFYSGLHLSPNGVYAVFLEGTVAPAFCNIPSNLVFLPLVSKLDIFNLVNKLSSPMRKNLDCLHEMNRLLQTFDLSTMNFPDQEKGKHEADDLTNRIIVFCEDVVLNNTTDLSKLELHKIQFRRAITMYILKNISKAPETEKRLQAQIDRYNWILALRQVDFCCRLFLKTDVQRQRQDCILMLRIATLCRRYMETNPSVLRAAPGLCAIVSRATEVVMKIGEKLLTTKFNFNASKIRSEALLTCPICSTDTKADLLQMSCSNGHKFFRCVSTFNPCCDGTYNECPSCKGCSVSLPDRHSQWRKEINGHFCTFCNIRMDKVVL